MARRIVSILIWLWFAYACVTALTLFAKAPKANIADSGLPVEDMFGDLIPGNGQAAKWPEPSGWQSFLWELKANWLEPMLSILIVMTVFSLAALAIRSRKDWFDWIVWKIRHLSARSRRTLQWMAMAVLFYGGSFLLLDGLLDNQGGRRCYREERYSVCHSVAAPMALGLCMLAACLLLARKTLTRNRQRCACLLYRHPVDEKQKPLS